MDQFKVIPEFPNYSVDPLGQVRNDNSGRILVPKVNQTNTVYVGLFKHGRQYQRSLALLVAQAFIPRPFGPFDTPICLNGNRFDCMVDNLMWRPRWFAHRYHQQFKRPYSNPIAKPIMDDETGEQYATSWQAAEVNGLLEKEVVLSVFQRIPCWPTYQTFSAIGK